MQPTVEMPGFGAAVEMLKGGISHHVEEETRLLPELKERLTATIGGDRGRAHGIQEGHRPPRPAAHTMQPTKRNKSTTKANASAASGNSAMVSEPGFRYPLSPVARCEACTGFDSGDPYCRRKIVNTTIVAIARNSDCQFCNDSNQNCDRER